MHGAVHDFIVLHTVKDGENYHTGEEHGGGVVKDYVKYKYKNLTTQPDFKNILDIGSLDICGNQRDYTFLNSGPRWLELVSSTGAYTGIDLLAGKNVDLVMDAHKLEFESETFDLVLCLQVLEHDSDWKQTIKEAYRILEKGGTFILTFALEGTPEHKHLGGGSDVYQHISEDQINEWLACFKWSEAEHISQDHNYFLYAKKV